MTGITVRRTLAPILLALLTLVAVVSCAGKISQADAAATAENSPTAIALTSSAAAAATTPAVGASTLTPSALDGTVTPSTVTPIVASSTPSVSATPNGRSIGAIAAAGTPTVVGTPAANPTEQAIQTAILNNNLGQMQAFANGNPTAMKDNATSSFYQEMVQSNQQLAQAGATSVQLVTLVWGPVSVQGSTAQATTDETWLTSYNDGSTELQESDKNVYDLVQSGGQWLINADDHPNDTNSTTTGGPSARRPTPTPIGTPVATVLPGTGISRNWSGYSTSSGRFTSVTGTWQVPHVDAQNAVQSSTDATWVGIGGITQRDLIQAGSQAEVVGSGDTVYSTWIELLPAAPTTVPLSITPGDTLAVTITQSQPGTWSITLKNNTTGKQYQKTVQYQSSNSSAEWIEEAASTPRRQIIPLDNFGTVQFTNASATRDGTPTNLGDLGAAPITLEGPNGQPLAVPSGIGSDGSSFTVTRA